jgi:hypothetical protein
MPMSAATWKRVTDEDGRHMTKGIIRFIEGGEVAVWRENMIAWSVTGSARAWGDPGELLRQFGPYEVIEAYS